MDSSLSEVYKILQRVNKRTIEAREEILDRQI